MNNNTNSTKMGFSLTELSIVLVVIGLIVGGAMGSVEIYNNAKLRQVITSLKQYSTAVQSFEKQYNYKAGDLPNATVLLGASDNGDGSGYVGGNTSEPRYAFHHLSMAGYVDSEYSTTLNTTQVTDSVNGGTTDMKIKAAINVPAGPFDKSVYGYFMYTDRTGVMGIPDGEAVVYGSIGPFYNTTGILSPTQAQSIDKKMDDGAPTTGSVFALNGFNEQVTGGTNRCTNAAAWGDAGATYYATDSSFYNKPSCVILYGNSLRAWFGSGNITE